MIIDLFSPLTNFVNALADTMAAGDGIAKGMISVAIMGGLFAALRKLPHSLYRAVMRVVTVSIRVDSSWRSEDERTYERISEFVTQHSFSRNMRIFNARILGGGASRSVKFSSGPQPGSGFFLVGLRPFWYEYTQGKENGAVPAALTVSTLGRREETVLRLIEVEKAVLAQGDTRWFKENGKEGWQNVMQIDAVPPIFLSPQIKEILDKKIDHFAQSGAWCRSRGLSHKLLIILHGEPGTGKSSISRYVANRLGYSLGTLYDVYAFTRHMREAADNSIVVSIPDFDTLNIANDRGVVEKNRDGKDVEGRNRNDQSSMATSFAKAMSEAVLSEVLNLFQGDIPIHNLVCVMSTNCIEKIDPALYRGSRCDLVLELPALGYNEVNDFYKFYYETDADLPQSMAHIEVVASDVMSSFENHAHDPESFMAAVMEKSETRRITGGSVPTSTVKRIPTSELIPGFNKLSSKPEQPCAIPE